MPKLNYPFEQEPEGIGGWLLLVALGLVVAPIRMVVTLSTVYLPIFRDGSWELVTTPGTESYIPHMGALVVFEVIVNAAILVATIVAVVLFFRRSYIFPRLYIGVMAASLAFIAVDAWLGSLVIADEPIFDAATAAEFGRTLVGCLVWIPYMLVSKRVKNTFVDPRRLVRPTTTAGEHEAHEGA